MPTKTLVASARAAHVARRGGDYGVKIAGEIDIDMKIVRKRAETVTMNARNGLIGWFDGMKTMDRHLRPSQIRPARRRSPSTARR